MSFIFVFISHIYNENNNDDQRKGEKMKLYLVYGDTWFKGYGCRENVFGIFATKEEAEIARKSAAKRLYEEEILKMSLIDAMTLTEVEMSIEISELELNQAVNIELGSYVE